MLKVKKSFNNNLILATDSAGTEVILKGKGIGFHKQRGDAVDEHLVEATFRPENENESSRFLQLFSSIPDDYWTIAEELLVWARETQGPEALSQKVILPLCDHLAGAVERYRNGVRLKKSHALGHSAPLSPGILHRAAGAGAGKGILRRGDGRK